MVLPFVETQLWIEKYEIDYVLSGLGYSAAFSSMTVLKQLIMHCLLPSVIYHNGGWMDHGFLSVMQALDTAASMGKGLIFWVMIVLSCGEVNHSME